jgi:hypothetical protein
MKLKVKGAEKVSLKVGDHVVVTLKEVSKQKITGNFLKKSEGNGMNDIEKQIDKLWHLI